MTALSCYYCNHPVGSGKIACPYCRHPLVLYEKYRILRRLGQGGFGVVYEAFDERLQRRCAIKRVIAASLSEQRQVIAEAQILGRYAARLPFIPQIYDIWSERSETFLVMEYIEGPTLDYVTLHPWSIDDVLRFFKTMLSMLAQLHAAGIVHRDIKPSNIKRTPEGRFVLLDFGIAKDAMGTLSAAKVAHSPAYASPEQVQGGPTDSRSDLYCLAATTYHLLTGRRPAAAAGRLLGEEVLQSPGALREDVPATLEETLLRMLALNPDERPATAWAALDLLDAASRTTLQMAAVRGRRWLRQRARFLLFASRRRRAGMIATLGVVLVLSLLALERALPPDHKLLPIVARMVVSQPPTPTQALLAQLSTSNLYRIGELARWGEGTVGDLAWSPDGKFVAVASEIGTYLYDAQTYQQLQVIDDTFGAKCVAFTPDGSFLATGSGAGVVRLYRLTSRDDETIDVRLVRSLRGNTSAISSLDFSPDGKLLAAGLDNKEVRVWDVKSRSHKFTLQGHTGTVRDVDFSPDGLLLASASHDYTVRLWRVADGTVYSPPLEHTDGVLSVAFAPDGQRLVSGAWDGTVRFWNIPQQTVVHSYRETGAVASVAFSRDGRILATATWNWVMALRDGSDGRLLQRLVGHTSVVHSLAFSPDGQTLVSSSWDGSLRFWNTRQGRLTGLIEGHMSGLNSIAASAGEAASYGPLLAAGGLDGLVRVWRVRDKQQIAALDHAAGIESIAVSPDGQLVASAGEDHSIVLWQVLTSSRYRVLKTDTVDVEQIVFSSNGKLLAAALADGSVRLWRVRDGQRVAVISAPLGDAEQTPSVTSVEFSPDGRMIALGTDAGAVHLFSITSNKELGSIAERQPGAVRGLAFALNGQSIAVASDNIVSVWDTGMWQRQSLMVGHPGLINSIVLAPNGHLLASASEDGTIRLWQVGTGQQLRLIEDHRNAVRDIAFLPDGTALASVSLDGTVRLWGLEP